MKKKYIGIAVVLFYLAYTFGLAEVPLYLFNLKVTDLSNIEKILFYVAIDLSLVLILYLVYRKVFRKDLGDFKNNWRKYLDMGIKYWLIGLIIMGASNYIIQMFFVNGIAENEETVRALIKAYPLYMIFATILYAPFVEETIFRKAFKDIFGYNWLFVIMSGLAFGGLHVVISANGWADLLYIIPYGSVGAAFAYLYCKTKNIWSTIVMHFIHNSIFVALEVYVLFF